jgi:hypothetical protein
VLHIYEPILLYPPELAYRELVLYLIEYLIDELVILVEQNNPYYVLLVQQMPDTTIYINQLFVVISTIQVSYCSCSIHVFTR